MLLLLLLLLLSTALVVVGRVLKTGRVAWTAAAVVKAEDSLYKARAGAFCGQGVARTAPRAVGPECLVLVVARAVVGVLVLLLVRNMSWAAIAVPIMVEVRVMSRASLIPV